MARLSRRLLTKWPTDLAFNFTHAAVPFSLYTPKRRINLDTTSTALILPHEYRDLSCMLTPFLRQRIWNILTDVSTWAAVKFSPVVRVKHPHSISLDFTSTSRWLLSESIKNLQISAGESSPGPPLRFLRRLLQWAFREGQICNLIRQEGLLKWQS